MSAEVLVALLSGTGLVSLVSVVYTIWRERRHNAQKDMAGDLTLGQLFREVARKEVLAAQEEASQLRELIDQLRDRVDQQAVQILELRTEHRKCMQERAALLLQIKGGPEQPLR